MSKADRIRRMHAHGIFTSREIAEAVGCTVQYVCMTIWKIRYPGYNGKWMANKRSSDPSYYAKELAQQRKYDRRLAKVRRIAKNAV